MTCRKCKSPYVSIQAVTTIKPKHHGFFWWLLIGWWWVPLKWIFLFLPALIIKLFKGQKYRSVTHSEAVCQNCGYRWKVG
jgi:hypothetical protein